MNKKLTTIMLAVLLLLIGKVDAATLTQYVGEHYISQTVNEGQTVRLRFINQSNYTFTNWTVESGNVTIDTTNPTITFTMPSSDVTIRGNYAEEVASSNLLSDVATVGAYVTYVSSSTSYTVPTTVSGYTSEQNYNPSNTTSWRVFSVDGTNIEIISTDSVGSLTLQGSAGYINAVQTLNDMSASFVNLQYAESGRSLGYYDETQCTLSVTSIVMTETEVANYKIINTSSYPLEYNVMEDYIYKNPYDDSQYMLDETALANHGAMYHSSGDVWLASRAMTNVTSSGYSSFRMRHMNSSGSVNDNSLYNVYDDDTTGMFSLGYGVRPVVSLKSGLTVTGSGTEDEPYVINESNSSQYTVTYCANGGYGEMNPQSVSQGSSITLNTNAYAHHSAPFLGWSKSSTATTATYTDGQSITPTADMTLYAVWGETLASKVSVGDYITYKPSSTSYTVPTTVSGYDSDQTYNPLSTTSWRVFSNDGTNVEIISADSVGTLYLEGTTGYINAVQTLNDISRAFVNSEYAISGRSLGYYDVTQYTSESNSGSAMAETELANYKTIDTSRYPLIYGAVVFPYKDYQYIPDKTVLANHGSMYHSSDYVWLASRNMDGGSDRSYFCVRRMNASGYLYSSVLYFVYSDGSTDTGSLSYGVRPIVSLKPNLTITGSGTESDPYVINESNPSQYTVTYNANGGYGEMNPQSVSQGSSLTLTTNAYEHHSLGFAGWSTDATATTATYTNGQTITPTADVTLYAVWGTLECACGSCEQPATNDGYCSDCAAESCSSCGNVSCYMHNEHCLDCYLCYDCANHCINCGACYYGAVCNTCHLCNSCGYTCPHCGECYHPDEGTCPSCGEYLYYCGDCDVYAAEYQGCTCGAAGMYW